MKMKNNTVGVLCLSIAFISGCSVKPPSEPFRWSEATIDGMQSAIKNKQLTCHNVIEGYIHRINELDKKGPQFNSVIALNPQALLRAAELDQQADKSAPLFCVPVVVKDNINVAGMPVTLGLRALKDSRPPQDAAVVKNLKAQGAIILAKTNLDELAIAMLGLSSAGGQTRNVYVLTNGPGGSSGGTASAVSASLAMVGLGTDTGGSVRIPSALAGLTGIRPSRALAELDGVAPLSVTQDTLGPMCRTIRDCASMLRFTEARSTPERQKQIMDSLNGPGLKDANIALISGMFPPRTQDNIEYWKAIDGAIQAMRDAGATVDEVTLPEQDEILNNYVSLARFEIASGLDGYLQSWSSAQDKHPRSFNEILEGKGFANETRPWLTLYKEKSEGRLADPVYKKNTQGRQAFVRLQISRVMEGKKRYDALLYPTLTQLNVPLGNNTEGRKNVSLSAFSGLPTISFMAGMAQGKEPQPVALEFLGREYAEPELINLVHGFEQVHPVRVPPMTAPELISLKDHRN